MPTEPTPPSGFTGSASGTASSSGATRPSAGLAAARRTSPTTASITTSSAAGAATQRWSTSRRAANGESTPMRSSNGGSSESGPRYLVWALTGATGSRPGLERLPGGRLAPERRARHHRGQRVSLHSLHLGHDGEVEARRPYPRRLPGRHSPAGEDAVRPPARRPLVDDVGHRLDCRPRLHRLRAAARRRADDRRRGCARSSRRPRLGRDPGRFCGERPLHVADRGTNTDAPR